jgi:hypothetical protein
MLLCFLYRLGSNPKRKSYRIAQEIDPYAKNRANISAYHYAIVAQQTHVDRASHHFYQASYIRNFVYMRHKAGNVFRKKCIMNR